VSTESEAGGDGIRSRVRQRYAGLALSRSGSGRVEHGGDSCCESGGSGCCGPGTGPESTMGDLACGAYSAEEVGELPGEVVGASLGCGNPVALATLSPGEVVLDLGSGGGIDVLLSARRVSPGGKAYGLDMTDEMLDLARRNVAESGIENAEFLKGEIEDIPLPGSHVDVVISNCVVNLSPEKRRVISEAYRVLKGGGRFAVSDVVFLGDKSGLPESVVEKAELWTGCISGALGKEEYEALLREAGFEDVSVEVTSTHEPETIGGIATGEEREALRAVPVASAFIRAVKPRETGRS